MDNVYVYVIDLPDGIAEAVIPCIDGYTVYLNARMSEMKRREAYYHAVGHIKRNDWDRADIQAIESSAHK